MTDDGVAGGAGAPGERQRKRSESYDACVAAQRLALGAQEYRPGTDVFRDACRCWDSIDVVEGFGGKPEWELNRELGWYDIPTLDGTASDRSVPIREDPEVEYFPLHDLQALVTRLTDADMVLFLQYVFIESATCFHTLFTDAFVGTDTRLEYIRAFISAVGSSGVGRRAFHHEVQPQDPIFFNGEQCIPTDFATFDAAITAASETERPKAALARARAAGEAAGKAAATRLAAALAAAAAPGKKKKKVSAKTAKKATAP